MAPKLPAWTVGLPKKKGLYLHVDKYGRFGTDQVIKVSKKGDTLLHTSQGLKYFDSLFAPYLFCGPLEHKNFFDPKTIRAFSRAIRNIPRDRLARAERVLHDNPRSRKAKAAVETAKKEVQKMRKTR